MTIITTSMSYKNVYRLQLFITPLYLLLKLLLEPFTIFVK